MTPEIIYQLWKNDVVTVSKELYQAAKGVGKNGIAAIDEYNTAHHGLWLVLDREPKL